ncbi:MAG: DNA recombination protein RmuC, partial [Halieaceae bacterium]|nr:DNA recombination protein RmuC [Halieaceae bacterium]
MELDQNMLIAAGIAAVACVAIGLIIGLLRGQFVTERLRRELAASNDELKSELSEAGSHIRGLTVELEQLHRQLDHGQRRLEEEGERLSQMSHKYHALQTDYTRLHTEHRERQDRHAEQVQLLNEARDNLKKEFENLANRIFEDKGKSFTTTSRESLEA